MAALITGQLIKELFMLHTPNGNELYLDEQDAIEVKEALDVGYKVQELSKRTPMYRIKMDYEVYDGS